MIFKYLYLTYICERLHACDCENVWLIFDTVCWRDACANSLL